MNTSREYGVTASLLNSTGCMINISYLENGFDENFPLCESDDVEEFSFKECCDFSIQRLEETIEKIKLLKKSKKPFHSVTHDKINKWVY